MNDSKMAELADLVADKVCDKLANVLLIGGFYTIFTGISVFAIACSTNIIPSFALTVYKKRA
jgi:hypothetical protein